MSEPLPKSHVSESCTPLSYAPTEIRAYGKHYILHEPMVCQAIRYDDDGYYSIRHDGLSIICGGDTCEEATREFNEWFVHNYKDFSAWDESHLGMFDEAFRLMKKLVKEEIDVEDHKAKITRSMSKPLSQTHLMSARVNE